MPKKATGSTIPDRFEDLPNVGKSIANDLRGLGIQHPVELRSRKPLELYRELESVTGQRHDPCILHTLLSVEHFLNTGERIGWWKFTEQGRAMLAAEKS